MKQKMSLVAALWLSLFLLLGAGLSGCPDDTQACPPPLTVGNLTPEDQYSLNCCKALTICCAEIPEGEDKDKCEQIAGGGAVVSCQAEYHTQVSFENCKPVYLRDHPELTPPEPTTNDASPGEQASE